MIPVQDHWKTSMLVGEIENADARAAAESCCPLKFCRLGQQFVAMSLRFYSQMMSCYVTVWNRDPLGFEIAWIQFCSCSGPVGQSINTIIECPL